ncbi:hypothetical protein PVAND_006008 [Polypedilum vanderplanki]|uniref:Uncharacterized protein n=1 Tax=Polypedilum vanderplanki TaxID=319348 RepID=A0A9J6C295_POLVA|nr:hypothetical protein PVAND_006008 [Polypedilum vanderplanki]
MKRKRQKSNDDPALNYFKQSPVHHIDQPNYVGGGFVAIQDAVKLEPREQTSPYMFGGGYRIPQTTPSPTPSIQNPVSPSPLFVAPSTSPYNQQPTNNLESILQNQLQATRQTNSNNNGSNLFQQQSHTNQMFTPNIPPQNFTVDNSAIWSNNLNGNCVPSTSRVAFNNNNNNNNLSMTSPIFNQALTPLAQQSATPVQIFNNNNNNEQKSNNFSSFLDLDSQQLLSDNILNNLSGELKNLSFGDIAMDSWSKNDINKTNRDK